jgi:predicted metallopeptidase
MPRYTRDLKVESLTKKIIAKYADDFGFIEAHDVYAVRDIFSMRHKQIASIGPVNSRYEPFFPKVGALLITIRQCNWLKYPKNTRKMVLYHELMHINPETREKRLAEGYKYVTIGHDMEEFLAIVTAYGPRWLRSKDLPDILKKRIKLPRNLEEYPQL